MRKLTQRDRSRAEGHFRKMLAILGVPSAGETKETPARYVRALEELTVGVSDELPFKFTTFVNKRYDQLCVWPGISFASLCSHHMLPFYGLVYVGYIPNKDGVIAGYSKIPRLVRHCAARPQTQEDLVHDIADQLVTRLKTPYAVFVVAKGVHTCARIRGVREHNAKFVTSAIRGDSKGEAKNEFFALIDVKGDAVA